MLHKASSLSGYSIRATDGDIGSVVDLLFDDQTWTVRWLVLDTGTWLSGRRVLLPFSHLGLGDREQKHIAVDLSREQVKGSPDVDAHRPVSRQAEGSIYGYYGWNPYWYPILGAGGMGTGYVPPLVPPAGSVAPDGAGRRGPREEDQNLRSTKEVTGYYIEARDGDIGHVEDFLVDEGDWTIRYIMVDTKNWWPGKFVLIAPDWAEEIRWSDKKMRVRRTREEIKSAPEFDPSRPVERDYESRLYGHYGARAYWAGI